MAGRHYAHILKLLIDLGRWWACVVVERFLLRNMGRLTSHPLHVKIFFLLVTTFWGILILFGAFFRFIKSPKKFLYAKEYKELPSCALRTDLGLHKSITIQTVDCGVSEW